MPHRALRDDGGTHSGALWTTYRAVILEVGAVTATGSGVYPGTMGLLDRLRAAGIPITLLVPAHGAVDSLNAGGIADRFDVVWSADWLDDRADGESGGSGALLEVARRLGAPPSAIVFVGSTAGAVRAARLGGFGLIVGVDRGPRPRPAGLDDAGADLTVADLGELDLGASRTDPWMLIYHGFDSAHEGHREALTTLGNGRMATRGSLPEYPEDGVHYPGTYVAGLYNRLVSRIHGRTMKEEHLVNLPNWLLVDVSMDAGPWWSSGGLTARDERRELDVKTGVLRRSVTLADSEGRRLKVVQRTFVSMEDPHVAVQQTAVTAEAWSGTVTIRTGIDARVRNSNVPGYVGSTARHLRVTDLRAEGELLRCEVQTKQSRVLIGTAVAVTNDAADATPGTPLRAQGRIHRDVDVRVVDGVTVTFTKVMSLFTSKDAAISAPMDAATARVKTAVTDVAALEDRHREAWRRLWSRCQIVLDADPLTQLVLNLHMFHLLQSVSPHTSELDAGISARGLHGEGYRGHVFWDEVFVTPVVGLRFPQTARALLDYRWRRLGAARAAAKQLGSDGAMFPWQSGSDGTEETPTHIYNSRSSRWFPDNSHRQRHVGLAIAWNAWQHFQSTGDRLWLAEKGAEILIEVTRFFVRLATYNAEDDRFHITGVMGPDEFHDGYPGSPGGGLRDNAYTNVLASWTCSRTRDALELLTGYAREDLVERLGVTEAELARWTHVASRLAIPFHEDGILSQFDGYEDLREFDWVAYRQRYGNIGRLDLILEAEETRPTGTRQASNRMSSCWSTCSARMSYFASSPRSGTRSPPRSSNGRWSTTSPVPPTGRR